MCDRERKREREVGGGGGEEIQMDLAEVNARGLINTWLTCWSLLSGTTHTYFVFFPTTPEYKLQIKTFLTVCSYTWLSCTDLSAMSWLFASCNHSFKVNLSVRSVHEAMSHLKKKIQELCLSVSFFLLLLLSSAS